jgi:hypothetical protein
MRVLIILSLAIPIMLQIGIACLLLWRKLQMRFPWFFAYILYALIEAIIRLTVSGSQNVYLIVYWSTAVPGIVFTVLALRESFLAIFLPETSLRWFRWIFWGCITVSVAFAVWQAWALPPKQARRLIAVILNLQFGLDMVISTFGLLYAGAVGLFGILEHQRPTATILGFTANSSIALFGWITRSVFGTKFRMVSEWIPALAYIVAEVIWTWDLLCNERTLPGPRQTLQQMSEAMDRYIRILHRYLGSE